MASISALRPAAVSVVALAVLAATSSCGKTITIGDSSPTAPPPPATTPAAPPASAADPAGGAGALQVVDSTAAQDGKTGDGGTVVGVTVQEKPPVWVQLSAVTSPPLNAPHLININQAALYRFDLDTTNPPASNCVDACAAKWPPVTIKDGGNVYLAGVDPKQVGAIRRGDGAVQITIGGRPVYRFAGDTKVGDLNGQGVGGTWFAVGPKGAKVTAKQS